jgi:AcrR family transcriptional regulator
MADKQSLANRRRERGGVTPDVLDAARKQFLHYGVNRTTMADVARELGIPRQTMYEYVSSRDELVDAVLVARITEIADELKPATAGTFTDALVETSVAAINRARNDHELMNIVGTGSMERVQQIVTGPNAEIHDVVGQLLGPILDRAQETGQLRRDQTRDDIIDWVRIVYLALITQIGLDPASERNLVANFLLPSLMFSPDSAARSRS